MYNTSPTQKDIGKVNQFFKGICLNKNVLYKAIALLNSNDICLQIYKDTLKLVTIDDILIEQLQMMLKKYMWWYGNTVIKSYMKNVLLKTLFYLHLCLCEKKL